MSSSVAKNWPRWYGEKAHEPAAIFSVIRSAKKTIFSVDTNKKYAGCHFAQIAAANASPCLARDLSTRYAAFDKTAVAANAIAAVVTAWLWLLPELCCESPLAQAACARLLRNAKMHTPAMVAIAGATMAQRHRLVGISKADTERCGVAPTRAV